VARRQCKAGGAVLRCAMPTEHEHLDAMHPWLRERVAAALAEWRASAAPGETILLVESVRLTATQAKYFADGRSKADGVNRLSLHQFAPALAADVAVMRGGKYVASAADPAWARWGAAAKAQGLEWGGAWTGLVDAPHVQVPVKQRIRLAQLAAGVDADGLWGPATERAIGGPFRGGSGWERMSLTAWAALEHG
jgi:hypothetical protein